MVKYHKLLKRQIKKIFGEEANIPAGLDEFLEAVSGTYHYFDEDRALLEQSMDLSSKELSAANQRLHQDIEQQQILLVSLKQAVNELSYNDNGDEGVSHTDQNPLSMVELIRKQVQIRKTSDANLVALIDNTQDSIWSVNQEMELLTFNSPFSRKIQKSFGVNVKVGMKPDEIFGPASQEARIWKAYYERALSLNKFTIDRRVKVGQNHLDFEISCSPIVAEGKVVGVTVFEKEITQRKKSEEAMIRAKNEAEEASKSKTEFLANTSHELRTPLNAIIGYSELICESIGLGDYEMVEQDAIRIQTSGKHLLDLINGILDLSKIEAGKMDVYPESVSIFDLCNHLASVTKHSLDKNKNVFEVALPEVLNITTDRAKLNQVLFNLIANAAKFTENGKITLKIFKQFKNGLDGVQFDVIDTGIGIPPEKVSRLFKPFSQADSSTTRKYGGTGLGLLISMRLCHLMQGDISFVSEVGKGSTFSVWLPLEFRSRTPLAEAS